MLNLRNFGSIVRFLIYLSLSLIGSVALEKILKGPPKMHDQLREIVVETGYTVLLTFEFFSAPDLRTSTVSNPDGTVLYNMNLNETTSGEGLSIVSKNVTFLFHGKSVTLEGQEAQIAIAITNGKVFGTYRLGLTNDLDKASLEFKLRQPERAEAVALSGSALFTIGFFVPLILILLLTIPVIVCFKKRGFSVVRMTEIEDNNRPVRRVPRAGYETIDLPATADPSNQDQTYEPANSRRKPNLTTPVSYENVEMQIQGKFEAVS